MKILDALRKGRSHADAPGEEASSPDAAEPPFPGYDKLDYRELSARLPELSQVELAAVESYERSHKERKKVLDKLRYMRSNEPMPGYDALSPEQIAEGLADADTQTVKAVRDYERKFGDRPEVMEAAARVLPTATASAGEDRAREEQSTRVREGYEGRKQTPEDREA